MPLTSSDLFSFGALLKTFRKRRHLTQQQLAETLGVHRSAIVRWEQGDYLPERKATVLELARHLHLDEQESRQLLEASLTALAPSFLVPLPRNSFFTGREQILEALHAQLEVGQTVALTQSSALHGLGGVGKSQIALEYAYRYALEYRAVFWIGAETAENITSGLLRVASVLQLPGRDDQEQQRVIETVQRWLSTHGQWLLIWDNVEDLPLLDRFLPATRLGVILITTRHQALGTFARGVALSPMEHEEGILFLLRRAKVLEPEAASEQVHLFAERMPLQYAAASELVTALGGLPLALDQAGAYLEEKQCGLPAYLDLFRTQRAALLQQRGEGARDHPSSVSTTFNLAVEATAQRHPAAWELLQVCALLQPDAMPEELFRQGGEHLGTTLEFACRNALEWNRVVSIACSYSLLSRHSEAQTLSVHRLVQAVLLDAMAETEQEQWTMRIIRALDAVFPEVLPTADSATWKQGERLLPHALLCLQRAGEAEESLSLASLAYKTAQYLHEHAQYEQAEPLYQRALHLSKQVLGPEHPGVARFLDGLALLFYKQGKYDQAERAYQHSLHLREQALGGQHPEVASSLYGLARLYTIQAKKEYAESLYQRVLHLREQAFGPGHPEVASSLSGLATFYQDQGKYEVAEPLFQRALSIWEQVLEPEHPRIAGLLYNLALLYHQQGKYEVAEPLFQRALSIWEQVLEPGHPDLAEALNGLANLYIDQGKYEQAEPLCQRSLRIWEQALGPEHPYVAYPVDTLGTLYYEQGKYELAEPLHQRALHIWKQAWGPEHPMVAYPLNGLANLSQKQEKEKQAELLYQQALTIREQYFGQHHPETAQTLHDLAIFRQKQGNLDKAISLAERALAIRSQSLGDAHPRTAASRALHAQLIQEQGLLEK